MIGFVSGLVVSQYATSAPPALPKCTKPASASRRPHLTMKAYNLEVLVGKNTYKIPIDSDQTVLEAIEENDIPGVDSSCRAGVCMTCSAKLLKGEVDLGVAALADEAEREGFILTCSALPKSDLKVQFNQFDDAYEFQYGKYEQVVRNKDDTMLGKFFNK